jgi:hypothetical protein
LRSSSETGGETARVVSVAQLSSLIDLQPYLRAKCKKCTVFACLDPSFVRRANWMWPGTPDSHENFAVAFD